MQGFACCYIMLIVAYVVDLGQLHLLISECHPDRSTIFKEERFRHTYLTAFYFGLPRIFLNIRDQEVNKKKERQVKALVVVHPLL